MHSAIVPPRGVWWKPAGKQERMWVTIAFVWCMVLFAMMPLWHLKGGQNPSGIRGKVEPKAFSERTQRFIADYQVGEENGISAYVWGSEIRGVSYLTRVQATRARVRRELRS